MSRTEWISRFGQLLVAAGAVAWAGQASAACEQQGNSPSPADAQKVRMALEAERSGDGRSALATWEELAGCGDRNGMVAAGMMYQLGTAGTPIDYEKAIVWYLKADNGDAINNLGVMLRDGHGFPQNRRAAFLMFLTVHMSGAGDEEGIMRANRNLRREIAELPQAERQHALCYTREYLVAYLEQRGRLTGVPTEYRASATRPRFKELNWWRPGELQEYDCPAET